MENMFKNEISKCEEITIDELIDQIYDLSAFRENTKSYITENFKKSGKRTYELDNLKGCVTVVGDSKCAIFTSKNNTLIEDNTRVMNGFSYELAIKTIGGWVDTDDLGHGLYIAKIDFKDGYIIIKVELD